MEDPSLKLPNESLPPSASAPGAPQSLPNTTFNTESTLSNSQSSLISPSRYSLPLTDEEEADEAILADDAKQKAGGFWYIMKQPSIEQISAAPAKFSEPSKREVFVTKAVARVASQLTDAAATIGAKRDTILEDLFHDITFEIEDRIVQIFGLGTEFPAHAGFYYLLLAQHYQSNVSAFDSVYAKCIALWNNSYHPLIFAALFFRVIFERETTESIKLVNELRRGANRLFWMDMRRHTRRFHPIYQFLKEDILLKPKKWHQFSFVAQCFVPLFRLVMRFLLYYDEASELPRILNSLQPLLDDFRKSTQNEKSAAEQKSLFRTTIYNCSLADQFAAELTDQLHIIKDQHLLIRYIRSAVILHDIRFRDLITLIKLQAVLYNISAPGGPFYAPRDVRRAAAETMQVLFPRGNITRRLVHWMFRLTQPYYTTKAFIEYIWSWLCVFFLLFTFWRNWSVFTRKWHRTASISS